METARQFLAGEEKDSKTETLLRQVKSKVELEGKGTDNAASVAFGRLFRTANGVEKFKLILGWIFAVLTGSVLPLFFFFIGPIFDSFGQGKSSEETKNDVIQLCLIMVYLSIGITVTSICQNYLLMSASATVAARLRTRYLQATLNQESAWYDQVNYLELPARLSKDIQTIQAGIGQKFGQILYSVFMSISGFFVGFYKGWKLALCMLAIGPVILIGMGIFGHIIQRNTLVVMQAYSQSAGYAEQALSAVRIVVSFGTEALEMANYNHYLNRVRATSIK